MRFSRIRDSRGTSSIVGILVTVGIMAALAIILWTPLKQFLQNTWTAITTAVTNWLTSIGL